MLRWLSADESLIGHGYGGEWAEWPVSDESPLCAKVKNIELDVRSLRDAIPAILQPITNQDRTGYMDHITESFLVLEKTDKFIYR